MTANLDSQVRYAQLLAESTLIPKHLRHNPANVLLFLALAEAQQVAPAVAFTGFQVIGDTPTMKPEMMRAQIMRHGHTLQYREQSATKCVLYGKRADNGVDQVVEWTLDTAKRAGLNPTAGTWAKYPQAMLSARATAELARALFADCLNGISYTPEELGAEVDDEGQAVEAHRLAMEDQARQLPADDKKAERTKKPDVPPVDEWTASDPVAVEEWKQVVSAAEDKDALGAAWSDLNALSATGQVIPADRPGLEELWNARKAEVMPAEGWPEVAKVGGEAA